MVQVLSLVLCIVLLCAGCGKEPKQEGDATTKAPVTTTKAPTTTITPTTTSQSEELTTLLVNCPDGKTVSSELIGRLRGICRKYEGQVSIYYKDLTVGYSIEYCADEAYQAASVIKAPYVKYLLASGVDLDQKLTMKSLQGGDGYIKDQPIGTEFTVGQLMEYAIRYSDNTAYYMLNQEFGFKEFNQYAKQLGIRANAENNCTLGLPTPRFGYLSARDVGLYFEDIARYIEKGGERAEKLEKWLTSTTADKQLVAAFKGVYTVAHKYGLQPNPGNTYSQAYHDGGIVYATKPYVLAITTRLEPDTEESNKFFADVARTIDGIHAELHRG